MKKVNLSVELSDNELFDKSFEEAIQGRAKQIAREAVDKTIKLEIERIIDAKLKEANCNWSELVQLISSNLSRKISEEIKVTNDFIDETITRRIEQLLNQRLERSGGIAEYIQPMVNKALAKIITQPNTTK